MPSVFEKNEQATIKRVLKPNELYKHLFSNCEIECKTELRSIASSLNGNITTISFDRSQNVSYLTYCEYFVGLAALSVIKNDYPTASAQYQSVLRWAKDHTGTIW